MTGGKGCSALLVSLGVLILLAGCSSRKVVTSGEDQSSMQKQGANTPSTIVGASPPSETTRITAPEVVPPLAPVISSQAHPSTTPAASSRPTEALDDVFFDFDRFTLRSDAILTLESNTRVLKARDGTKLLIEGHCDERGTLAYNLVLGERRAQSVKQYLHDLGIPVSQLHTTSYGKERPSCQGAS